MDKKKIIVLASYPQSLMDFRGHLLRSLIIKGYSVIACAPGHNYHVINKLNSMGVSYRELYMIRQGFNPIDDLHTLFSLIRIIKIEKPTMILAYTIKPVVYGMLAAKLLRVPNCFALITGTGYSFTGKTEGTRGLLRKLLKKMYKLALRNTKSIFFQNPDDQKLFGTLKIINPSQRNIIVNGSGIDLNHFSVVPLPENISFLMIARLLGDKGVREYIHVAKRIKKRYPNIIFCLVGWIDESPDAVDQKELDEWINVGAINFLGKVGDVRPAIKNCSVYVLPSYREGTPRSVLEAMAMGRPIITSDAPGCRETVINNKNGFLVPVKSVDALEEAMLDFIKEPDLCVSMGRQSRKIAEEKYDVHKVNAVMLKEMGIT